MHRSSVKYRMKVCPFSFSTKFRDTCNSATFAEGIFTIYYLFLSGGFLPTLKIEESALPAFFRCRSTKRLRGPECGARCDKKRIEYLPLDRTIRLMKIPIVTPHVLRCQISRSSFWITNLRNSFIRCDKYVYKKKKIKIIKIEIYACKVSTVGNPFRLFDSIQSDEFSRVRWIELRLSELDSDEGSGWSETDGARTKNNRNRANVSVGSKSAPRRAASQVPDSHLS